MSPSVKVSFFVPCYNEELVIQRTLEKLKTIGSQLPYSYEILVFDDNSKDKSIEKISEFSTHNPTVPIRLFRNLQNCGLGFNYIQGAFKAKGEYYILVNGDDSETPESLELILSKLGQADVIIPYMIDVRAAQRKLISNFFTRLVNLMSGHNLRYYNGPCLHKTENVRRWHPMTDGYAYQAEILCLLLDHKQSFLEVEISHNDRDTGTSKAFRLKNILSVSHSLSQIALRRLKYALWPARDLKQLGLEVSFHTQDRNDFQKSIEKSN